MGDVICISPFDVSKEERERLEKEAAKRERKEKRREKWKQRWYWVVDHKEGVLIVSAVGLGVLSKVLYTVNKGMQYRHEINLKDLRCYDNRLGHYWLLRRALNNAEWLELEARVSNGEKMGDVLSQMRVLK